jgi:RNA polymerase sigma-70 factor (ECF subfamily)
MVNTLYDALRRGMLRYLVHENASVNQAEDIVQDVFMDLYAKLRSGKSIQNPRAWLFMAARRAFWKDCDASNRLDQLDEIALAELPSQETSHEDELAQDDLTLLLRHLTPRERQVITLRLSGLKYREMAAQLGISFKTAHTLLTRALKKLDAVNHQTPAEGKVETYVPLKAKTLQ